VIFRKKMYNHSNLCTVKSVELYRDGINCPWGFRLKGGIDVEGGTPLEIIRVFVGSASEGLLMPGDKVVGINHQDATKLTHLEAQNLIKHAGTSAKIDVVRPGYGGPGGYNNYSYDAPLEPQTKEFEAAKVLSQPYRTTPLVSPTPKPLPTSMGKDKTCPLNIKTPKCPSIKTLEAAQVVSDAISQKQPYRTTPLVIPAPKTINDMGVTNRSTPFNRQEVSSQPISPISPNSGNQQVKTINIGGTQKQIVSSQFNSPLNMYSEEAIAESALTNQALVQSNVPTLGQIQNNNYHPGYVPSSKPHLPTPRDATFSRPQASETFKIILESEMDKAKDHQGMTGSEFQKDKHPSRPSSVLSNNSSKNQDPFMMNNNINQSTSFKRLMYSLGEAEM